MEIILREDVEKLGHRGQVVKVAPGYARNFLIPRNLAVPATAANKKIVEQERHAWLRKEAKLKEEAEALGRLMSSVSISLTQKAGEEGQLFGSVTAQDLSDALAKLSYNIDRKKIQLDHPIKQVGEYKVPVRLHKEVTIEIPVNVVAEAAAE